MKVPLLDLAAIHEPLHARLMAALESVLKSQTFILGPEVERLEARLAAYCQTPYAVGVSSGTDALLIALMALNVKEGDEIITTPYTFFATGGAIARLGARQIFVDIDPDTYTIDAKRLAAKITSKTKAVIPVHLYGQCADMQSLLAITEAKGIPVIEDAAQAIGTVGWDGRRAGSYGTMGCFSSFPSKNLGGLGDGGLVTTRDKALYESLVTLRVHGSQPKYYHRVVGGNFRIDALQAAVLNVKLDALDDWTRQRRQNAQRYRTLLNQTSLVKNGKVKLPVEAFASVVADFPHIYNQFVLRADHRDALRAYLQTQGIGTEVYYPVPLHLQECFVGLGYKKGDFPDSERAALETLALPIYPGLTSEQQAYVVGRLDEFYRSHASK